jgi:hypothetical protein
MIYAATLSEKNSFRTGYIYKASSTGYIIDAKGMRF